MDFLNPAQGNASTNSQIVVSENMASCTLDNFAKSPIGFMEFTSHSMDHMFKMFKNLPKFVLSTETVGKYLGIIKKHAPRNKEMKVMLNFKDIEVKFGEYDTDIILSYTTCVKFLLADDDKELMYDEIRMITSGSVRNDENTLYAKVLSHKIDNNSKY